MSTILKALRRLEEEKASAEPGRPLREQVAAASPPAPERAGRRWLAVVAALVLSAVAGGSAIWWLFGAGREEPEAVASAPTEAAPAPVVAQRVEQPAPAPAPARQEPATGPPSDAFASEVGIVARPDPLPRLADAAPIAPRKPPAAGTRRPVEDSAAAARHRAAALQEGEARRERERQLAAQRAEASQPEPQPAPVVAKAPAPAPAPRPAASPPPPAPKASAPEPKPAPAPAPVVAAVTPAPAPSPAGAPVSETPPPAAPGILVERTQWHPASDRRSAWLQVAGEERRVVEGDVVEGMLVDEIQPSGVVFERDGEALRRGVGER